MKDQNKSTVKEVLNKLDLANIDYKITKKKTQKKVLKRSIENFRGYDIIDNNDDNLIYKKHEEINSNNIANRYYNIDEVIILNTFKLL